MFKTFMPEARGVYHLTNTASWYMTELLRKLYVMKLYVISTYWFSIYLRFYINAITVKT